jgi:dihydrofolate reductase
MMSDALDRLERTGADEDLMLPVIYSMSVSLDGFIAGAGNARLATDDIATEIGRLRDQPGEGEVGIGGANLAAAAIAEDLIDEYRLFVNPVILGGRTPYFPPLAKPLDLRVIESRTFNSRVVYLRYQRMR